MTDLQGFSEMLRNRWGTGCSRNVVHKALEVRKKSFDMSSSVR
jgi:hypothetical protein